MDKDESGYTLDIKNFLKIIKFMLKDNIKATANTYKGYDYQTLFGVSILADWLNFPDKYQKFYLKLLLILRRH